MTKDVRFLGQGIQALHARPPKPGSAADVQLEAHATMRVRVPFLVFLARGHPVGGRVGASAAELPRAEHGAWFGPPHKYTPATGRRSDARSDFCKNTAGAGCLAAGLAPVYAVY